MTNCIYRLTRGKREGELCSKRVLSKTENMCVPHARLYAAIQAKLSIRKCLCGQVLPLVETDDWCEMVTHHTDMCHTCSAKNDVATCNNCGKVGLTKLVKQHFEEVHCTIAVNNTSLSVKKRNAFRPSSITVTSTCQVCDHSSTCWHDMMDHAIDHMTTIPVQVPVHLCPEHGSPWMMNGYCSRCMVHQWHNPAQGYYCRICQALTTDAKTHFETHLVVPIPTRTHLTYTCSHIDTCQVFDYLSNWKSHFETHVNHITPCPFPDCTTKFDYHENRLYWHFDSHHCLLYTYNGETSKHSSSFNIHKTAHIRNALVEAIFPQDNIPKRRSWRPSYPRMVYNINQLENCAYIGQLATWAVAMKCVLPQSLVWCDNTSVPECKQMLRDFLIEYCTTVINSQPCSYEYTTLPFELWDVVYKQLDCKNRIALAGTCTYLQQIHKTLFGNTDHMTVFVEANPKTVPSKYGYVSVSSAKYYWMLSSKELKEVPASNTWNNRKEYKVANLVKAICNKYGTIEKFLQERTRRRTRTQEMYNKRYERYSSVVGTAA